MRQALPGISTSGLLFGGELRRALGDERVRPADPDVALLAHVDDHLAAGPERIRQRARVADRHRGRARAVAHTEVRDRSVARVPRDDLAGQLVGAGRVARRGGGELARAAGLARRTEARPDEAAG